MSIVPDKIRIASVDSVNVDGLSTVNADIRIGEQTHKVFFKTRDARISPCSEAWYSLALLPSMKLGADLVLDAPLSQRLLSATDKLSFIHRFWWDDYYRANLSGVSPSADMPPSGEGVGAFFTGGIDSFYTLLKHRDEITHLIYVHGADVPLQDVKLRSQVSAMLRRVGKAFNVEVIEIESNARGFFESCGVGWDVAHAAGLACHGHLLASHLKRIYIPSSAPFWHLIPWGSHPATDHMWGSEALEFVHDGLEAGRLQKTALVAQSEVALTSLRVCYHNPDSAYNCGCCEKCVRTMLNLHVAGALDGCMTFPNKLDLQRIKKLILTNEFELSYLKENLLALENRSEDRELYVILRDIYRRPIWLSRLQAQFWRRMRTWKRSVRRRLGVEPR